MEWATRISGLVGYGALTLSMLFGLLLSSRGGLHAPTLTELHRQWSWVGLMVGLFHGILKLTAAWHVWEGTLGLIGMGLLVGSFYVRARIGPGLWRGLHALAFGSWGLVAWHGLTVGTDMANPVVDAVVRAGVVAVLGGVLFRVAIHSATA